VNINAFAIALAMGGVRFGNSAIVAAMRCALRLHNLRVQKSKSHLAASAMAFELHAQWHPRRGEEVRCVRVLRNSASTSVAFQFVSAGLGQDSVEDDLRIQKPRR